MDDARGSADLQLATGYPLVSTGDEALGDCPGDLGSFRVAGHRAI